MWTNVKFYSWMFKILTHLHSEIKGCKTNSWQTPQQPVQYVTCVGDYRSPMGMISSLIKNSMVSSSQSSTLLSSSSVSTPTWHKNVSTLKKKPQRQVNSEWDNSERPHLLWARGECSFVLDKSSVPPPGTVGSPPSLPCACPPAPTHTEESSAS